MKNETNVMDERQKQINSNALAAAGIFLMVCISVSMIYKVWTTGNTGWEFWALLGSGLVSGITQRILGDIEQPKSISGKPLPVENTKEAKEYVELIMRFKAWDLQLPAPLWIFCFSHSVKKTPPTMN